MHPVLFEIYIPEWLQEILPETITVYSYGFMIALGSILGLIFTAWQAKKRYNTPFKITHDLILLLLIAGIIGGKVFMFFEDPSYYAKNLNAMITSRGFVFYGSLLFCIPSMLIYFHRFKLPTLGMLDIMAITTGIVHGTGRIGCLLAGCCHGIEWSGPLAIIFTDPMCVAPLNTPLHPTQLYSVAMIFGITGFLFYYSKRRQFDGQIFILYIVMYAFGRIIIEFFRGDESRGYVVESFLTNSQFISILIIGAGIYYYRKLHRKKKTTTS